MPTGYGKTLNRAALVTMEPSSVRSKRNEVCERNVGIVPHGENEEPEPVVWRDTEPVMLGKATNTRATRYRIVVLTILATQMSLTLADARPLLAHNDLVITTTR